MQVGDKVLGMTTEQLVTLSWEFAIADQYTFVGNSAEYIDMSVDLH